MWDTSRFTEALGAELARSSVVVENIVDDPEFCLTIEFDDVLFRVARAGDALCLTAQCTQEEESSAHYSVSATPTTPLIQRIAQACFQAYEELSLARILEEELSAQSLRFARHFPPAHIVQDTVHGTAHDTAFLLATEMFESVLGQGKDGVQTLTLDPKQARCRAPVQSCLEGFQKIKSDVFGPDFEDIHMADKEKITFVYLYQMLPTLRKHLPQHFLTTRWGAAQYDKVGLTLRFQGDGENEYPMQICM
jgi:hypothetical protein